MSTQSAQEGSSKRKRDDLTAASDEATQVLTSLLELDTDVFVAGATPTQVAPLLSKLEEITQALKKKARTLQVCLECRKINTKGARCFCELAWYCTECEASHRCDCEATVICADCTKEDPEPCACYQN